MGTIIAPLVPEIIIPQIPVIPMIKKKIISLGFFELSATKSPTIPAAPCAAPN